MVKGNTEIHKNIAPAYDAFLSGEASGGKGLEALKKAGYSKGSDKDKQGFVSGAFEQYQQARELGVQAQNEQDPTKRKALENQRQKLMERGNLLIGMQEQMEILQKPGIFEDKTMQNALGASGGTMSLNDANGNHKLLPNGGSWTDFQTRMGLKKVEKDTPQAIAVKGNNGQTTHYLPDPSQKGTIVDYFSQNASGAKADNLNKSSPRPVELAPENGTGRSLDGLGQGLSRGDLGQIASSSATLVPRIASDLTEMGGQAVQNHGKAISNSGVQRYVHNFKQKPGWNDDIQRAAGFATAVGGEMEKSIGNKVEFAGEMLNTGADMVATGTRAAINATGQTLSDANRWAYKQRIAIQKYWGF